MSWLAPLFLGGLAAIALPIWLHRLQTETPKRQMFSSAMLLLQADRRVHVQKKLRYWVLLALRIALLVCLAFAFAKPLWTQPPVALSSTTPKLHVVLLDTSMSMQEGNRWQMAVKQAQDIISQAVSSDRLELITLGDELQVMAGPITATADGKQKIEAALQRMIPTSDQVQYGAVMNGLELLLAEESQPIVAHLISDFQQTALPVQFGQLVPRSVNGSVIDVVLHRITNTAVPNFVVSGVERVGANIQVKVQGYQTKATALTVALSVNGVARGTASMTIAESGSEVFEFSKVALNTGSNRVEAKIESADTLVADNVFYTVLENTIGQPVPFLSVNPAAVASKYLDAAFTAAGSRYALQPFKLEQFDVRALDRYRFVVIEDLGAMDKTLATVLEKYVQQGGAVFAAVGERSLLSKSLPLVDLAVTSGAADQQTERFTVGQVDVNHAALSRATALRSLNVTRYLAVAPSNQSRTLVQLDNGAPLLLEQRIGQGRVLLFTSSLDNTWNDLPVQPVFVSLMAEATRYLAGETLLKRQQYVGGHLALDQATAAGQVINPLGKNLLSISESQRARSVKLDQQGFYEVVTAAGSSLVAVNAIPEESNLMPMTEEEFTQWQQALAAQKQRSVTTAGTAVDNQPKGYELWSWLLVILAITVLMESLLGNTYVSRRVEVPT
jgi:hypothetical protein